MKTRKIQVLTACFVFQKVGSVKDLRLCEADLGTVFLCALRFLV